MIDFLKALFIPENFTTIGILTYCLIGMLRMYLIFVVGFSLKDKVPKLFVAPIFIIGFIYDIWLNWWLSFPFKDLPASWDETITLRMIRYQMDYSFTWRGKFASWLCSKLNKYDKGHC
jgi:hypothetical protein